jgi:hypothetical protein
MYAAPAPVTIHCQREVNAVHERRLKNIAINFIELQERQTILIIEPACQSPTTRNG